MGCFALTYIHIIKNYDFGDGENSFILEWIKFVDIYDYM